MPVGGPARVAILRKLFLGSLQRSTAVRRLLHFLPRLEKDLSVYRVWAEVTGAVG